MGIVHFLLMLRSARKNSFVTASSVGKELHGMIHLLPPEDVFLSQLTFSEAEFENEEHKTRRELFLQRMDQLIPWAQLEKKIAKHYPKGETGRPPYPLSVMLRVHCLQLFYNLSENQCFTPKTSWRRPCGRCSTALGASRGGSRREHARCFTKARCPPLSLTSLARFALVASLTYRR